MFKLHDDKGQLKWSIVIIGAVVLAFLLSLWINPVPFARLKASVLLAISAGITTACLNPRYICLRIGVVCVSGALIGLGLGVTASLNSVNRSGETNSITLVIESAAADWVYLIVLMIGAALVLVDRMVINKSETINTNSGVFKIERHRTALTATPAPLETQPNRRRFSIKYDCRNRSDDFIHLQSVSLSGTGALDASARFNNESGVFVNRDLPSGQSSTLLLTGYLTTDQHNGKKVLITVTLHFSGENDFQDHVKLTLLEPEHLQTNSAADKIG